MATSPALITYIIFRTAPSRTRGGSFGHALPWARHAELAQSAPRANEAGKSLRGKARARLGSPDGRPSGARPSVGPRSSGTFASFPALSTHLGAPPHSEERDLSHASPSERQRQLSRHERFRPRRRLRPESEFREQPGSALARRSRLCPSHCPTAERARLDVGAEDVRDEPCPTVSARRLLLVAVLVEPELELIAQSGWRAERIRIRRRARDDFFSERRMAQQDPGVPDEVKPRRAVSRR